MKQWAMIATWRMSYQGVIEASHKLQQGDSSADALEAAICLVEDNPQFKSVGFGGLPNEDGEVELDAAFMDGLTMQFGAVASVKNIKNPIKVARRLSTERYNCVLVGEGAERYATLHGFEKKNMLTEQTKELYEIRKKEINAKLASYDGHDTVGVVCLDQTGNMVAGTSTSGLFMKKAGRVGDSPIIGSGFYVDDEVGGACCTGVGEDLMKGCLSYEAVRQLREGKYVKDIAQPLIDQFTLKLKRKFGQAAAMSIIVMDQNGNWAVGTNVMFSFVVSRQGEQPKIYLAKPGVDGGVVVGLADEEYLRSDLD